MMNIWHGCYDNNNFGDHIGNYIIEKLTGIKPTFIHPSVNIERVNVYSGSVLQESQNNWHCYGLGFGESNQICKEKPSKIYSVRGRYSRDMLLRQGIECPEIYFDICQLLPMIYKPKVDKRWDVSFIPHFLDWNEYRVYDDDKTTHVINICDNPEKIIHEVLQSRRIISTSLHGLILSDVYKIPNKWEKSKQQVSEFKFHDYFTRYEHSYYTSI